MRRPTLRVTLGTIVGVRISLHVTWFVVAAGVIAASYGAYAELFPTSGAPVTAAMAAVTGASFFVCLTAHELAHAAIANRLGFPVRSIVLFAFGGAAEIEREADTPSAETAIALAGPALSVALGSALGLAGISVEHAGAPRAATVLAALSVVNIGVALFNLLPGLPLDGGRLLRAGIWRATGDRAVASRRAGLVGAVLGVALGVGGAALWSAGQRAGLWYVPMGVFLVVLAVRAGGRPVTDR